MNSLWRMSPSSSTTGLLLACALLATACGGSGGHTAYHSIGGTISGLSAAGLVLANGGDTVTLPSGATSFTFPTALPSGMNYVVSVTKQPTGEMCQVVNGSGKVGTAAVTNVAVTCARVWTWMGGSNAFDASGTYGTKGLGAADTSPGAHAGGVSWNDGSGTLWLFGGFGVDSTGASGLLNDLWSYSPSAVQWTWVSGSNTVDAMGVYGTQGVGAANNVPGARSSAVSWTDSSGALWLFGGHADISTGASLNDLWRYSPSTGQWTWVSGSNTVNALGAYGMHGVGAADNVPGARSNSVSWTDSSGTLWLFGGFGVDSTGANSRLNDLWSYSPSTGQWTWVSGSNTVDAMGVYGTKGVGAVTNAPGARVDAASWIDSSGTLWLLGGAGIDSTGASNYLNDLWSYSPTTARWIWVGGSNTVIASGIYGVKGAGAANNIPGARSSAVSWTDSSGTLWLFGGAGTDSTLASGNFNDLWHY
jgi:N-acetylneuraminic acid mutarotase